MKTSFLTTLALAGLLAVAGGIASAQAQNLVANGDFNSSGALSFNSGVAELNVTPVDDAYDFGTGWFARSTRVSFNQNGVGGVTTSDGSDFLTLESASYTNGYGGTQRSDGLVNTYVSLQAGTSYKLSFDAQLVRTPVSLESVYLSLGINGFLENSTVWPLKDAGHSYGSTAGGRVYFTQLERWGHYEYIFTPSVDWNYQLVFGLSGLGNPLANTGVIALDNVSITAVPEPAAFAALAGLGALGCAALRRRRAA